MYRYQHFLLKDEALYIAGPECFYTYGYDALGAMKARAKSLGFGVTLPNDDPLDLENEDLQKRADSIFENLEKVMLKTTAVIADLEAYRGSEPDSGTIYELGMAYAKGAKCYGYTRDKRSFGTKNLKSYINNNKVCDELGNNEMYQKLPFAPTIIGSTKIVEGNFDDCLTMFICDKEEEIKTSVRNTSSTIQEKSFSKRTKEEPLIYISGVGRYKEDAKKYFEELKQICSKYGLKAVAPTDWVDSVKEIKTDNPYIWAANVFDNYQQHVRECDIIIADLNDYRGYEINNDVGFECGMGFQLGKKLYGHMQNTLPLIERIPHMGEENEYRDHTGCNVENFNYPANLMFSCSMDIIQGGFEDVVKKVARECLKG